MGDGSEALPEDDLRAELLVLVCADPGAAEVGHVGQRRPAAPHGEVSIARAADAHAQIRRTQEPHLLPQTCREPRQQCVPACATHTHTSLGLSLTIILVIE